MFNNEQMSHENRRQRILCANARMKSSKMKKR